VIERLRDELPWDGPLSEGRGRGMAIGARSSPSGERTASVVLTVLRDGRIDVLSAIPDQGGGAHTMLQRVVAEVLGIALERVKTRRGTTAEVAYDLGVGGSRVTPVVGGAALCGARTLADLLDKRWPGIDREAQLGLAAAAGDVSVTGEYEHPGSIYATYAYGAIVSVDRDTGRVSVVDSIFVADVGTVINPLGLRGQLVGAIVSGIGQALTEEVLIDGGQITTAHYGDYSMPAMRDVPPLRIALVDGGDGAGPFGAKSAAELGNVPIAPAIANAVHDAVGVRITSLPITPEKVLRALRDETR
jgi:CO/xanthine dehydrogenase Mo-binding subunit